MLTGLGIQREKQNPTERKVQGATEIPSKTVTFVVVMNLGKLQ